MLRDQQKRPKESAYFYYLLVRIEISKRNIDFATL